MKVSFCGFGRHFLHGLNTEGYHTEAAAVDFLAEVIEVEAPQLEFYATTVTPVAKETLAQFLTGL